jgi:hypothetical protein
MNQYFNLLVQKLFEQIDGPRAGKVNIVRWLNFTTFDLIGDLCFGESFDALRDEEYNAWIANIWKGVKVSRYTRILRAYPVIGVPVIRLLMSLPGLGSARQKHVTYTKEKAERRMAAQTDRRDFMR